MFPVAYARVSSKSTKAADSDTGDTDVKKVLQENYSCKLRKWYRWGLYVRECKQKHKDWGVFYFAAAGSQPYPQQS